MQKQFATLFSLFLMITLLLFLSACSEKKERQEKKSSVISKKIAIKDSNVSKSQLKKVPSDKGSSKQPKEEGAVKDKKEKPAGSDRIYDPKKRLDPFAPLFRDENEKLSIEKSGKTKRVRREAQTPLEKIGVDQLKLVAIIRGAKGNRAMVEDASGKGYILKNGTYVGLNSGRVININKESIVIEEDIETILGEYTTQKREIKLQKPPGE